MNSTRVMPSARLGRARAGWKRRLLHLALGANLAYPSPLNFLPRRTPAARQQFEELTIMTARSARNIETRKKKARRRADRPKVSRPTGNTAGVRRQLKKLAGLRNGRSEVAETSEA